MRQLVSVVTDTSVSYFLAEEGSDHVHQVAQVMNTGLEVPDVIDLGANLLDALKLNGTGKARRLIGAPAPDPAPTHQPASPPALPAPSKAKAPNPARRDRYRQGRDSGFRVMRRGTTADHEAFSSEVLTYVQAHPGCRILEVVTALKIGRATVERLCRDLEAERQISRADLGYGNGRYLGLGMWATQQAQPQQELTPTLGLMREEDAGRDAELTQEAEQ